MSDWVRPLFRATGASGEWHVPRIKGLTTTTYCGENIEGPIEVAREDKAERERCCSTCVTRLAAKSEGMMPQRPHQPMPRARKAVVKKPPAKKAVKTPAPKERRSKAPLTKRPVRRPRGRKS